MDNFGTNDPNQPEETEVTKESELSHSDKIAGIITEPASTFESIAKFPPRTMDWLLPVILMLVIIIVGQFLLLSNPAVKYDMEQQQREATESLVEEGKMTQEQVDQQVEMMSGPIGATIRSVSILIFGFIFFLIVSGIYFLAARFILKGDGSYISSLVANGLTAYIVIIQVILATALSMFMGRMIQDVSIASLLDMDKTEFLGWLLSFIDVISIWAYIVLSIGLAKMFKAADTTKYFVMVFGLWIFWKIIVFVLGSAIPFLRNF